MAFCTNENTTQIVIEQNIKIVYKRKKIFGGLLSWWIEERRESIGKDLVIETRDSFDKIIINGKEIPLYN